MDHKFWLSQEIYDVINDICRAFTNYHIRHHPFYAEHDDVYLDYRTQLFETGRRGVEKKKGSREDYLRRVA